MGSPEATEGYESTERQAQRQAPAREASLFLAGARAFFMTAQRVYCRSLFIKIIGTTILQSTCNSDKMVVQKGWHTRLSTRVPLLTQQPSSFFNYYEMAVDFRLGMRQEMRGKSCVHLENTQGKN